MKTKGADPDCSPWPRCVFGIWSSSLFIAVPLPVQQWSVVCYCVVEFGAFTSVIITHVYSHGPAWLSLFTEAHHVFIFPTNMSILSSVFLGPLIAPWGNRGHGADGAPSPGTGLVGWHWSRAPSPGWPDEAGPGTSDPSSAFCCSVERSYWVLPPSIQGGPGPQRVRHCSKP